MNLKCIFEEMFVFSDIFYRNSFKAFWKSIRGNEFGVGWFCKRECIFFISIPLKNFMGLEECDAFWHFQDNLPKIGHKFNFVWKSSLEKKVKKRNLLKSTGVHSVNQWRQHCCNVESPQLGRSCHQDQCRFPTKVGLLQGAELPPLKSTKSKAKKSGSLCRKEVVCQWA